MKETRSTKLKQETLKLCWIVSGRWRWRRIRGGDTAPWKTEHGGGRREWLKWTPRREGGSGGTRDSTEVRELRGDKEKSHLEAFQNEWLRFCLGLYLLFLSFVFYFVMYYVVDIVFGCWVENWLKIYYVYHHAKRTSIFYFPYPLSLSLKFLYSKCSFHLK